MLKSTIEDNYFKSKMFVYGCIHVCMRTNSISLGFFGVFSISMFALLSYQICAAQKVILNVKMKFRKKIFSVTGIIIKG